MGYKTRVSMQKIKSILLNLIFFIQVLLIFLLLFDDRIELFCAVGKDATEWEDSMDWICVMASVDSGIEHSVLTSSHESEPLEDVMDLARLISVPSGDTEIEIIRV